MKNQPFHRRLRYALRGIAAAFSSEKSFRTHCLGTVFALGALAWLQPAPVWWALVILTCGSVLALELVNSALETIVDLLHPEIHPAIARAKDCAAGAVLVLSLASLAVFAAMLWNQWG